MSTTRTQPSSLKPLDEVGGRNADFWADVPSTTSDTRPALPARSAGPARPNDPLHHAKRLLRGRWPLLIGLSAAGGVLGAVIGFTASSPVYKSSGRIIVQPVWRGFEGDRATADASYTAWMRNEKARIAANPEVAKAAMATEIWADEGIADMSPTAFSSMIKADRNDGDFSIDVSFNHPSPKIAYAGTLAALEGYEMDFYNRKSLADDAVGGEVKRELDRLEVELAAINDRIAQLAAGHGGTVNLDAIHDRMRTALAADQAELDQMGIDLRRGESLKGLSQNLTLEQLAENDTELGKLIEARAQLRSEEQRLARTAGPANPVRVQIGEDLKAIDGAIAQRAEAIRGGYFGTMPNLAEAGGDRISVTKDYLEQLQARMTMLEPKVEQQIGELQNIAEDRQELATLDSRRQSLRENIRAIEEQIEITQRDAAVASKLNANNVGPMTVTYPQRSEVSVAEDGRVATALGGGIMGVGIPAGLVLLLGLLDKRTRYSDDAGDLAHEIHAGPDGGPAPMLGVLPDLPDRLSDPRQASIAAHCVHQIRTILQIHHAVPAAGGEEEGVEEPRAFAVTSGGPGDGKTSLALALGLSYAASGCRTLLIDTDLRGGGLSKRLNVTGDEGVMDALVGGDLLDVTCETEVPNLAVLPIGNARGSKAGVFSPNAVRRLVRAAKQHFDVILLDCGPILGSIEATPVASASDATILVVSRNQAKPTIQKAAEHLTHVGATVAGIVFNRAGSADFERSVAGMNYRVAERPSEPATSGVPARRTKPGAPAARPGSKPAKRR